MDLVYTKLFHIVNQKNYENMDWLYSSYVYLFKKETHMIVIKRAYEEKGPHDGYRILVDRLWPRGLTKERVAADVWMKEIAPSTELRKWFGHDPKKWAEFRKRYEAELKDKAELVGEIKKKAKRGRVTLLYGAKDELHNEALVLKNYIESR